MKFASALSYEFLVSWISNFALFPFSFQPDHNNALQYDQQHLIFMKQLFQLNFFAYVYLFKLFQFIFQSICQYCQYLLYGALAEFPRSHNIRN